MGTYWNNFIEEYGNYLSDRSLRFILEVFYVYCKDGSKKASLMFINGRSDNHHEVEEFYEKD